MRNVQVLTFIVAAAIATGCSGGSTIPAPGGTIASATPPPSSSAASTTPVPASSPVTVTSGGVTYTASIRWTGLGQTTSSALRGTAATTGSIIPLTLTAPTMNTFQAFGQGSGSLDFANVTLQVSPAPSPAVTPQWTVSGVGLTSSPNPGGDTNVVSTTIGQIGSGTISASIPSIGLTATANVYVFPRFLISCGAFPPFLGPIDTTQFNSAFAFESGAAMPQTTIAASDLYVTGPNCSGVFQDPAALLYTVHFPFGATLLATPNGSGFSGTPITQVTAAMYDGSITSIHADQNGFPPKLGGAFNGSPPALILKTSLGQLVKIDIDAATGSLPFFLSGAFAQKGFGVDGF
jgi:hypothetical protein